MTGKQLIENWFTGNTEEKIPPCALLKFNHIKNTTNACNNLRMIKYFMLLAQKHAVDEGVWEANTDRWSTSYAKRLWERVGAPHLKAKYGGKNRSVDISWKTMHKNMAKKKDFDPSV